MLLEGVPRDDEPGDEGQQHNTHNCEREENRHRKELRKEITLTVFS